MSNPAPWFEMPSPFEVETGKLLLLEPPWAKAGELRARLLDETYPKPFVVEDSERRYLYFNVRLMQSAMRLKAPNDLDLRYTQKMMSFLLFHPRPRRIVLIGLGGGSLVKFCRTRLPAASMTAVELDEQVIAFREAFLLPPDGPLLSVLQGDGSRYLAEAEKGIDILLVDAFDRTGFAPSLANREFFENAAAKLSGNGVLVANLAGERSTYEGLISEAQQAFADQVLVFPVPEDGNHILMAFRDRNFEPNWRRLANTAKELRAKYGLDFPAFVHRMERASRQGLARWAGLQT